MAEQEIANLEEEVVVVEDEIIEDEVVEPELDNEGNPVVVEKELEPWQQTEDDGEVVAGEVPVDTHIRMKQKLKGRLKDQNEELDTLRAENERLKQSTTTTSTELPPRPKAGDYDTDEAHDEALEDWRDKKADIRTATRDQNNRDVQTTRQHKEQVDKAVEAHYARSAKLVIDSGMSAESFKDADTSFRQTIETVMPNKGDGITDFIISVLGEGSEKVIQYIGRNKLAKAEFQNLLVEDPEGNKAMVYLGQQKERLNNPKRETSSAPKPANNAKGDAAPSQSGAALKKKYDEAHKKGNLQAAYDFKKQAKAAKVDVSSW